MLGGLGVLTVLLLLAQTVSSGVSPPVFYTNGSTPYEAGLQHGSQAASLIQGWFAAEEMQSVISFVQDGLGRSALEALKRDNSVEFPDYAEELRGIADGARVDLDQVWVSNLLEELESLMNRTRRDGHCSDIYAVSPDGGIIQGHNEDWSRAVMPFWYFVVQDSPVEQCAGLCYPGSVFGYSATWNAKGLYATQNLLFPVSTRPYGLAAAFVQKRAVCKSNDLEDVVQALAVRRWSDGASLNVVDLKAQRMVNVEIYEDSASVYHVERNYSHFNMFKQLCCDIDGPEPSSIHRQARVDALPPTRSRADVLSRLSDTADPDYPIYRNITLTTLVLDGISGVLDVWVGCSALGGSPLYSWNISAWWA